MKRVVFFLAVLSAVQFVALLWVIAFVWSDSYEGRTIVLDAVSVQISILETMLAVGGLALAFLGFWGYQKIRDFADEQIQRTAEERLPKLINDALNERGLKKLKKSMDEIPTAGKENEDKTE